MTYIVDTHCHLDLIEEKGIYLDTILQNCQELNVKVLQTISTKISNLDQILSYTQKKDFIYASAGIHPCNVQEEEEIGHDKLIEICKHPKIIGIGETGLDYFHDKTHMELQKRSFIEHIKASQQNDLPVIIHSRDADDDMIKILQEQQKEKSFPALLHCFSSGPDLAKKALDLGMYISISGIVTFKNATALQEIVKQVPLEYLLVETDSPYLAPTPHRGKINQPAYTSHVVDCIAELKNVSRETIADQTTKNFFKIFKKAPASESE